LLAGKGRLVPLWWYDRTFTLILKMKMRLPPTKNNSTAVPTGAASYLYHSINLQDGQKKSQQQKES
jgi:hypothetical protein